MPKQNKRYTGEFKQEVIETMHREMLGYKEAEERFEIPSHGCVPNWERIYLSEGPEGLYKERRGKGSKGWPRHMGAKGEEDLLAELQRLRVENVYLKNYRPWFSKRNAKPEGASNPGTKVGTSSGNSSESIR